ncbi:MAG: hypothetical protein ACYDA6_06090 [Solirubrobacteraceae bacterium]
MCHDVLQDPTFFRFLSRIDQGFAAETRAERCPDCSGPLHVSDYPRKPRGCPASVREEYSRRLSFTCGRCDARSTSPSVRFAGRRVYLAVVLMLRSPPGCASGQELREEFNIPASTLKRWRTWWREDFPLTPFWQSMRARFMPPLAIERLPQSVLERFDGDSMTERLSQALRWIAPLSTRRRSGNPRLAA